MQCHRLILTKLITSAPPTSVTSYDIPTGLLVLEHAFPRDAPRVPRVQVDVTLTLESLSADELSDGSWVNVIGYVRTLAPRRRRRNNTAGQAEASTVQAVLLWSAGAVRIADYQGALSRQQELAKQLQTASPELLA